MKNTALNSYIGGVMKSVRPGLLVFLALAGCSSDAPPEWAGKNGITEPAKLVGFIERSSFQVRWQADVGEQGSELLLPALTKDAIYGVSARGALTRINATNGKKVWRIWSGYDITGGVAAGDGLVLIGSDKGDVLAYDESGNLKWKVKVSSEVLSISDVSDGMVLVRSGDGRIAGLNIADGKREWLYERSTPALVVRSHAGVTIKRGVAYAGFAGGRLAAINIKNGEVIWEAQVSVPRGNTELERISDITSTPVINDEQVYAISFQGRVASYEASQGNPIWNREISSDKGLAVLRKYLYLSDSSGSVMELDKTTGSTSWKNDQLAMRDVSAPYVNGKYVIVGDFEGYLHAMNLVDGSFAARIKLEGGAIRTAPIEMNDGLIALTQEGELYFLTLQ